MTLNSIKQITSFQIIRFNMKYILQDIYIYIYIYTGLRFHDKRFTLSPFFGKKKHR